MKAEDFIELIEQNRFDKISKNGMTLIAERFRELQSKQLTLTDVSKCNCDGNDDVFEEQYVLQHLINNTWQVVGEKTNTVWKQGKKEDCIKWMDL